MDLLGYALFTLLLAILTIFSVVGLIHFFLRPRYWLQAWWGALILLFEQSNQWFYWLVNHLETLGLFIRPFYDVARNMFIWLKQISGRVLEPLLPLLHVFWLYYTRPVSYFAAILSKTKNQSTTFVTPFSRVYIWLRGSPLVLSRPIQIIGSATVALVIFIVTLLFLVASFDPSFSTKFKWFSYTGNSSIDDALLGVILEFAIFSCAGILALLTWPFVYPVSMSYSKLFWYWAISMQLFFSSIILMLLIFLGLAYIRGVVLTIPYLYEVVSIIFLVVVYGYPLLINPLRVLPHLCGVRWWRITPPLVIIWAALGFGVYAASAMEKQEMEEQDVCVYSEEGERICKSTSFTHIFSVDEDVLAPKFVSVFRAHSQILRENKELAYSIKMGSSSPAEESCRAAWENGINVKRFLVEEGIQPDRIHVRVLISNSASMIIRLDIFDRKEPQRKISPTRLCFSQLSNAG